MTRLSTLTGFSGVGRGHRAALAEHAVEVEGLNTPVVTAVFLLGSR
jgi:hypothetical protein